MAFAAKPLKNANLQFEHELSYIDFDAKKIEFSNNKHFFFERLISTIPLPILIAKSNAPDNVKKAAKNLNCSSVLIINIAADHVTARPENWIYVYDEDKYCTRINCTELLSPANAPEGTTGVQVEVYFSAYKPQIESDDLIASKVIDELIEMKLVKSKDSIKSCQSKSIKWANVIFDHQRRENQNIIFNWLNQYGLLREHDDLEPMTNWDEKLKTSSSLGDIALAGRFGQWKYYWTDDCVLRGLFIGEKLSRIKI